MRKLQGVLLFVLATAVATAAGAVTISFDDAGLVHGSVVTTQYAGSAGLTISAQTPGGSPQPAVAFDSALTNTLDDDLEFGTGWSRGNLSDPPVALGMMLIINENTVGCTDGICDNPDDEGDRDAGLLIFDFSTPILSFGFDLVDIEGTNTSEENGSITFFDSVAGTSVEIMMATFLSGFDLGNNSANRVPAFTAADLGLDQIDRVELLMGGSGAVDNLVFEVVPEPSTAGLLGLGLAALAARARARRR